MVVIAERYNAPLSVQAPTEIRPFIAGLFPSAFDKSIGKNFVPVMPARCQVEDNMLFDAKESSFAQLGIAPSVALVTRP
ncbi:hypothetical protein D0T23_21465 [Duganella sp. BJB475]|nr:hypothetical protein D0T23_21465 [Duganella sp. BJB475]